MALVYKIGLYTSNNEIVIVDNTGYYSSSNTTGWNNNSTAFIQSLGVTNITGISITIDTNTAISIDSTTNTAILAGGDIDNLLTPESLIFTLKRTLYFMEANYKVQEVRFILSLSIKIYIFFQAKIQALKTLTLY